MLLKLMHFYQVMIIKHLSERNFFWLATIWTVIITVLSLVSFYSIPNVNIIGNDKIIHFLFYFLFVILWGSAIKQTYSYFKYVLLIVLISIIYGIVIEILQNVLTNTRKADFNDVLANSAGSFVGSIILYFRRSNFF